MTGHFVRNRSVVIKCSTPKHTTMAHHAFSNLGDNIGMAIHGTTTDMANTRITRVHKADIIWGFLIQKGVTANRVGRVTPRTGFFSRWGCRATTRSVSGPFGIAGAIHIPGEIRIPTMAICTTNSHGCLAVRILRIFMTRNTICRLGFDFFIRLLIKIQTF